MPGPTLTPDEIAQVTAEKAKQQNFASAMTAAVPQKTARAAELAVTDGAFKKFFDYYNTNIIGNYDAERKSLDGNYIANPITEADILGPATLDGSVRTTPTSPVTDIIRVAEFDGTPLIASPINETQHITDQAALENNLVNGWPIHFNASTAKSNATLGATDVTLKVTDPTNPLTIVIGDVFIVSNLTNLAVVKITSVTADPGTPPPYNFTYGITFLVTPASSIPTNSSLQAFSGFTNSERSTKTASNTALQPLLNYFVTTLQSLLNSRLARLTEQSTALNANQDPDGVTNITAALSNINAANTFLAAYLVSTDISNTGLTSLATERMTRSSQISTRVTQIVAAYTGQTQNYYNQRYTFANNRGNTAHGSLRMQKATEESVSQLTSYAAGAVSAIAAFNSILP